MARFREIPIRRGLHLAQYADLPGVGPVLEEVRALGPRVAAALGARRVMMVSSTAAGGGVAEMIPRLCCLLGEVGVDARWLVLEPEEPRFFPLTRALHDMLHGEPGFADEAAARRVYEEVSAAAADELRRVEREDLLIVHDPQPAGILSHLRPAPLAPAIWRCHVGTVRQNPHTEAAWRFLSPYLAPYARAVFSVAGYVPEPLWPRSAVIRPGIDPLAHKNRELRPYKLVGVLRAAGLAEGPPLPDWARFRQPALQLGAAGFEPRPIPELLYAPVILQVSRFDRLKGFDRLLAALPELERLAREGLPGVRADPARVRSELERARVVLVGPSAEAVADDPRAGSVLEELVAAHRALPPSLRARVHLVQLSLDSAKHNALAVNALQRVASVIVQLSRAEGFGLTVTEALWKGTPLVASAVGGIAVQVRDGVDGLLVASPDDPAEVARAIAITLGLPQEAENRARSGRRRAAEQFLSLGNLRSWLRLLAGMLGVGPREAPGSAP